MRAKNLYITGNRPMLSADLIKMINTERNQPTCVDAFLTEPDTPASARRWQFRLQGYAVIRTALQLQPTCHRQPGQGCEHGKRRSFAMRNHPRWIGCPKTGVGPTAPAVGPTACSRSD